MSVVCRLSHSGGHIGKGHWEGWGGYHMVMDFAVKV
jgi:hypothetical protein